MDDMQRLDTSQFQTQSDQTSERSSIPWRERLGTTVTYTPPSHTRSYRKEDQREGANNSMLIKVGICVAAACLALMVRLVDTPAVGDLVAPGDVQTAVTDQSDFEDMLGRLKFVELPGVAEVFGSGGGFTTPVDAQNALLIDDDRLAMLEGTPNSEVVTAMPGTVVATGEDEELGLYVRVRHTGDLETVYYGLDELSCEADQPVEKEDTLGVTGEDGIMYLEIQVNGRPVSAADYLTIPIME